jgi:putative spermidine/putrescine transport system permease protein
MFRMVLVPLLTPGILAAGVLILVRTVAMFELTFLVAGPKSETLIVALYSAAFSTGIRSAQTIDAMAVIYTVMTSVLLMIALRFVNPTQIVGQVKGAADDD